MPLLIGLGALVAALHVLTANLDYGPFYQLAVRTLDVAFDGRDLRPRCTGEQQEARTTQNVPAEPSEHDVCPPQGLIFHNQHTTMDRHFAQRGQRPQATVLCVTMGSKLS